MSGKVGEDLFVRITRFIGPNRQSQQVARVTDRQPMLTSIVSDGSTSRVIVLPVSVLTCETKESRFGADVVVPQVLRRLNGSWPDQRNQRGAHRSRLLLFTGRYDGHEHNARSR